MAATQPAFSSAMATSARQSRRWLWLLWILVSVAGGVAGSLLAWQVRALPGPLAPDSQLQLLRYVAILASAVALAAAQWFFLRRQGLDVYWWIPATVAAELAAVAIIIPSVTGLAFTRNASSLSAGTAVFYGALALGISGLAVGTAQALVFRPSAGKTAWAWIPATVLGGALAGALTAAFSFMLGPSTWLLDHPVAVVTLAPAAGSLIESAAQTPVLARLLR